MAKARWQDSTGGETTPPGGSGKSPLGRWKGKSGEGGLARSVIRLFIGLFALTVVVSLAVIVFLYLYPVSPPKLVLLHASYRGHLLPPNTYANNDAKAVLSQTAVLDTAGATAESLTAEGLQAQIDNLPNFPMWKRWLRWNQNTLLVYVNTLGVVMDDPTGGKPEAYLLGSNFQVPIHNSALQQSGAVRFKSLLDAVITCNADRKVLVLDCQRIDHHWPMGMFRNDFVALVKSSLSELTPDQSKGLSVLFSSGAGEATHYDPEFRLSPFGRFFVESLSGGADLAENGGNADGRVQFNELASLVNKRVSSWTSTNRVSAQQPEVMEFAASSTGEMSLVALDPSQPVYSPIPAVVEPEEQEIANRLEKAWQEYYRLSEQTPAPWFYAPRAWRYTEDTLLQCERLLLAGDLSAASEAANNAFDRVREVEKSQKLLAVDGAGYSVAMDHYLALTQPATTDQPVPVAENLDMGQANAIPLPRPVSSSELDTFVAVLRDIEQDRDIDAALGRLDGVTIQQTILPVEILTARMLQQYFLSGTNKSEELLNKARSIVRLSQMAEQAAAPATIHAPWIRQWIQKTVDTADTARRWKTDTLLASLASEVATQPANQVPGGIEPSDLYETAATVTQTLSTALDLRYQVLAEVPHLVHFAAASRSVEDVVFSRIEEMVNLSRQLDAQLEADSQSMTPEAFDVAVTTLRSLVTSLAANRDQVLTAVRNQKQQLVNTSGSPLTPQNWSRIVDLLHVPFASHQGDANTSAGTRMRMLDRLRQQIQVDEAKPVLTTDVGEKLSFDTRLAQKYILLRNGRAVQLASLPPDQIGKELAQSWQQAYVWAMQDDFKTAEEDWLHRVETATRLFDGFVAQLVDTSCVFELHDRRLAEFFLWHAQRAANDFWAALNDKAQPYFALVGQQYLLQATRYDPHGFLGSEISQATAQLQTLRQVPGQISIQSTPSHLRLVEQLTVPAEFRVRFPETIPQGLTRFSISADNDSVSLAKASESQLGADRVRYSLTRNARSGKSELHPTVLFRGHQAKGNIDVVVVDDEAGPAVSYVNEKPADAKLSVRLAANQRSDANILFVLDCSSSMQENQKMAELQRALRLFADGAARNSVNVGVRLFGDQVVWTADLPEMEAQARVDTRNVMPIQPFDPQGFENVVSRLRPVGSTPLYYALIEARKDFDNVKSGPKRIVVISDGADNWATIGRKPDIQDLRDAYADSDIEINTVGFQIGDAAYTQLQDIAAARGGVAVRVTRADALFKFVTGLQGAIYYSIVTGLESATDPILLSTRAEPRTLSPGQYTINLSDSSGQPLRNPMTIRLAPGESHVLEYYRGVLSYPAIEALTELTDPTTGVTLSVLAAEKRERDLRLRIALHKTSQPGWRPESISLFARPAGSLIAYPLQHLGPNVAGYHVAVWEMNAKDWPETANLADLEVIWSDYALPASSEPVLLQWGEQPIAGRVPAGTRLVYRNFEPRDVVGARRQSALVKVAFTGPDYTAASKWTIGFPNAVARSWQVFNSEEGIFTGLFALQGELRPDALLLYPPADASMPKLKLSVPVSVPIIP